MTIKRITAIITALAAMFAAATEPTAEKIRFLTGKLGASTVQVHYFFKNDDSGREPPFSIKYWCSNCNYYHHGDISRNIANQRPLILPGFITGEKTIISSNTGILPGWLDRIEIRQNGQTIPLTISGFFPERQAVELTAPSPLPAPALAFQPAEPGETCYYFYVTSENGLLMAGARPASDQVVRCLNNRTDYAVGGANALLTDADGNPVTAHFRHHRPIEQIGNTPPGEWSRVPADAYFRSLKAREQQAAQSFYPIHIRLFAQEEANQQLRRRYSGDGQKNDFYSVGVLIAPDLLLVPVLLDPMQTARLERLDVSLPDGQKAAGQFAGSLREYGAFLVKIPVPGKPLPVTARPLDRYFETTVYRVPAKNNNGKLQLDLLPCLLDNFETGRRGEILPEPDSFDADEEFLLNAAGELMMIPAAFRSAQKYSRAGGAPAGNLLAAVERQDLDPENIPRAPEERSVIAWLGADFQELTEELVRVHNASTQTDDGDNGLLVSRVRPDSPAARAGLMPGDIVLYVRSADSGQRIELDGSMLGYFPFDDTPFPWDKLDELPEKLFDQFPPPWDTVENEINQALTTIGINKEAVLGVIRKGEFSEHKMIVEKAPDHYENAPRYTAAALGLTVADPTFEVREVIRLAAGAAGVIVSKVVPGSPAAVAGIKPFEVIVSVNDKPVLSTKDFAAAVKDQKNPVFAVRRMAAVRTVKIAAGTAAD